MRLQLDSTGIQGAGSAYSAEVSSAGANKGGETGRRSATDSVGLSGASRALQTAQTIHSERLQRIGEAVRAGTYSVPAKAISQAIVGQAGSYAVESGK